MDIFTLTTFFKYCTIINGSIFAVWALIVGFAPNGYGLYDMAGNVSEWCQDWYQWNYYSLSPTDNPQGPDSGNTKITRGGHWYSWHKGLRVYNRGDNPPDVKRWQDVQGFRCVRDLN